MAAEDSIEKAYQNQWGMDQDQWSQAIGDRPCPNEIKWEWTEPQMWEQVG
jgi:hypothetical protein